MINYCHEYCLSSYFYVGICKCFAVKKVFILRKFAIPSQSKMCTPILIGNECSKNESLFARNIFYLKISTLNTTLIQTLTISSDYLLKSNFMPRAIKTALYTSYYLCFTTTS